MSLIHFLIFLQIFWTFTEAKSNCDTGFCQTYPFDVYGDAVQEKELVGHVFHNSVTSSPVQCYLLCKDDCRCLSFNYKEMNDAKYCELNGASHFTHDSFLKRSAGSRYYNMRRFFHQKRETSCVGDVTCTNGCCRSSPCLNGGTCTEICEPTSVRYNCSCPVAFSGKHCETQLKSCQDHKAAGSNSSGLYTVSVNNMQTFQVFCDFNSEPGFAWNLIESFSLSNKGQFQKDIVFYEDYPAISGDAPNWQAYLIKRPYLLWLRNHSTHWRATCRYNTDGIVYTDYARALLESFDFIRDVPTVVDVCRPYEYVNIRGNECVNCTTKTWYKKGVYPLHIDSYYQDGCDFNGSRTDAAVYSEDNFGLYFDGYINPKFRCTSSENDTTQIWIGGK